LKQSELVGHLGAMSAGRDHQIFLETFDGGLSPVMRMTVDDIRDCIVLSPFPAESAVEDAPTQSMDPVSFQQNRSRLFQTLPEGLRGWYFQNIVVQRCLTVAAGSNKSYTQMLEKMVNHLCYANSRLADLLRDQSMTNPLPRPNPPDTENL
jgi:hypothetical protein